MSEPAGNPHDQGQQSIRELRQKIRAGQRAKPAAPAYMEAAILEAFQRRSASHEAIVQALGDLNARATRPENPAGPST